MTSIIHLRQLLNGVNVNNERIKSMSIIMYNNERSFINTSCHSPNTVFTVLVHKCPKHLENCPF